MKSTTFSKLTDPYFIVVFVIYVLALIGLAFVSPSSFWPALLLGFGMALLSGIVWVATNKREPQPVTVIQPRAEMWSPLIWYGLVMLLAAITLANGVELVNQFTNWLFLVLIPLGLLALLRRNGESLRVILHSVGFTRANMKDNVKLAVLIMPLTIPLLYVVGEHQRIAIQMIFNDPLRGVMSLLINFALALFTAGFVEEFFFRGILQSRVAACLGSEWRGVLVASFLFGILHLPMYFFSPYEPTHGNLLWSVTSVITDQAMGGVLLGILWSRTHNLTAPILLHAFINAFAFMSAIQIGTG